MQRSLHLLLLAAALCLTVPAYGAPVRRPKARGKEAMLMSTRSGK